MPKTENEILLMYDISVVDGEKAVQRDPEAIVEEVKAEAIPVETVEKAACDCGGGTCCADGTCDCGAGCAHLAQKAMNGDPPMDDDEDDDPEEEDEAVAPKRKRKGAAQKAEFSDDERKKLAKSGAAMPDGSFPIRNAADLHNAMQAIGRAKDPAKAKAHIRARARALGLESQLSDAFKAEAIEPAEKAGAALNQGNRGLLSVIRHALGLLMGEEAKEPEHKDIAAALTAAEQRLVGAQKAEATPETPEPVDTPAAAGSASAPGAEGEDDMANSEEILAAVKALGESVAGLSDRLTAVEAKKAEAVAAAADDAEIAEARKAGKVAASRVIAGAGNRSLNDLLNGTPGLAQLQEIGKATPLEKRPSLRDGLRILMGRDVDTGHFLGYESDEI